MKMKMNFLKALNDNSIEIVKITEKHYPEKLRNIDNPPYILFYKGRSFFSYMII